jgi:hypothetical protein
MELPEEILLLIREYAKPIFKYRNVYHNARKRFRLIYFPNIKPCLCKNPERILQVLKRLDDRDEEFIRLSNEFQKRYWEYVESGEVEMKRKTLQEVLDELLCVREQVCRISYQRL